MINLLIALVALFLLTQGIRFAAHAKPAALIRGTKMLGGLACFGVAAMLFLRGHTEMALGAAGVGLWLGGWASAPQWLERLRPGKRRTLMRSAMIEIEFDPSSGAMDGRVLAGPFEGRALNSMATQELQALHRLCAEGDPEGLRHLEIYFDGRFAGWRGAGEGDAHARTGSDRARHSGTMTEDEAYEVLGLQKGAARDDITRAHRTLMKKLHPDQGGPTALAARVNEAKEILMRRHQ
ncbi:MAG: heat shock protein DnaJ domain protein [Hyphomicrobiales bacterium]|nr:heat shock protein DnaJ domain protein [Hyphomicrobiales bacterium]